MDVQTRNAAPSLLSLVIPLYNEQAVIGAFHARLATVLGRLESPAEIVYVNDGSTDRSLSLLLDMRQRDQRIAIVDADLQDPPELIPELLKGWEQGYDVVCARRIAREGDTWLKRLTAAAFYRLLERSTRTQVPRDTGDFRLLSRRAVDAAKSLREQHRFMKGLFAWIGFPQLSVPYRREPRHAGRSKWSYWKLWNLAIEGLTSFTIAPLKFASYLGAAVALLSFAYAAVIIYKTIAYGNPVSGYPSLMVTILFLGGVQLLSLGVIGEYLGRIFNETKHRPLYLVSRYLPAAEPRPGMSTPVE